MIYYHEFLIDLPRYAELGKENDFPDIDCCPICRAKNRLQRHGFYERNALEEEMTYRIPICRLLCPDCGKTVSILPTFLLPYFQYTMACIIRILLTYWMTSSLFVARQLRRFYEKRVYGKQTEIELFFREEGEQILLPSAGKEKAIKMLQMIQALGKATFVRRWWRHRVNSFMAASLYHGSRVAKTE
ncbi:DUF6431 domain-containing protein [Paenibacillus alkaliterrae]|uniref:DUF6431 domain-containing protein n=1 Tax=Paenibacillus alkaliterrae TaxID=320909 RepID=UPI001F1D7CA4|nr:DUF6431 domain-containing protein [Paenibacillus alkaliterrae]MCF2940126.1 DUF6431 domain-containing protein [Paenibacillus alkaliterrae]